MQKPSFPSSIGLRIRHALMALTLALAVSACTSEPPEIVEWTPSTQGTTPVPDAPPVPETTPTPETTPKPETTPPAETKSAPETHSAPKSAPVPKPAPPTPRAPVSEQVPKPKAPPASMAERAAMPSCPEAMAAAQEGVASWYGDYHHGQQTASGAPYDMDALTAAHPDLPIGSRIRVTNRENGRSIELTVNDRGPITKDRIIDVSSRAARELGFARSGVATVRIERTDAC